MESRLPENGLMAVELVDRLIEDGIVSARQGLEGHKLDGALEGFELARNLPATYEDFDWTVSERERAEREMIISRHDGSSREAYWRHRYGTLQLEMIRNVLLVAKFQAGEPMPPNTPISGRAVMRYAAIVGVSDETRP